MRDLSASGGICVVCHHVLIMCSTFSKIAVLLDSRQPWQSVAVIVIAVGSRVRYLVSGLYKVVSVSTQTSLPAPSP